MKIVILSSLATDTGCWLRMQYLATALRKAGNTVTFVKPVKKTMPLKFDLLFSFLKNLKIFFIDADVFIGMKPFPNVTLPLLIKKAFGARVVVDIDDVDYGYRSGLISWVTKLMQTPFPRFFDMVTYHNDTLRQIIAEDFNVPYEKLYKLEQGVDLDIFNPKKFKPKKKTGKVLVYTGHLDINSYLEEMLHAFKIIVEKRSDVRMVIVGCGPMENQIKKFAAKLGLEEKVIFTGFVQKNDQVARHIFDADVCLIYWKDSPANRCRCSMKLREYLAMGKIVVCNKVGELKDFGKYTYQSGNSVEEFAEKILEVLNGKTDGRERRGRSFVLKNYSWEIIGKKFAERLKVLC